MNELSVMKAPQDKPGVFWGEMAPCDHLLQFYDDDTVFLDSLEGFAVGGIISGDGVIIIATPQHREALHARMKMRGVDINKAKASDQYIALDAEETLTQFMVAGWPDDELFEQLVHELLLRARGQGRKVRAFGEMVALLWARGDNAATVRLEHLWHTLCHAQQFSLLCAYPKSGFTSHAATSMQEICAAHTRLVA